jgi:hypothetical protein
VIVSGQPNLWSCCSATFLLILQNPITGPDAFETYEGDFPFWQAIDNAFRKYLLTADTTDSKTLYYYNQVPPPPNITHVQITSYEHQLGKQVGQPRHDLTTSSSDFSIVGMRADLTDPCTGGSPAQMVDTMCTIMVIFWNKLPCRGLWCYLTGIVATVSGRGLGGGRALRTDTFSS